MSMLPFQKENKWPKKAKVAGESRYGFSESEELMEDAVKELMAAIHVRDFEGVMDAIKALVLIIKNKHEESDNVETREEA
jgi:hypothetical protein